MEESLDEHRPPTHTSGSSGNQGVLILSRRVKSCRQARSRSGEKMSVVREERIARWERHFTLHHLEDVEHAIHEWPEKQSIEVPFRTVESHDPSFAQELLHEPQAMLEASEMALHAMLKDRGQASIRPRIRIQGLPKDRQRAIRNLRSDDIGPLSPSMHFRTKITSVRPPVSTRRPSDAQHVITASRSRKGMSRNSSNPSSATRPRRG